MGDVEQLAESGLLHATGWQSCGFRSWLYAVSSRKDTVPWLLLKQLHWPAFVSSSLLSCRSVPEKFVLGVAGSWPLTMHWKDTQADYKAVQASPCGMPIQFSWFWCCIRRTVSVFLMEKKGPSKGRAQWILWIKAGGKWQLIRSSLGSMAGWHVDGGWDQSTHYSSTITLHVLSTYKGIVWIPVNFFKNYPYLYRTTLKHGLKCDLKFYKFKGGGGKQAPRNWGWTGMTLLKSPVQSHKVYT